MTKPAMTATEFVAKYAPTFDNDGNVVKPSVSPAFRDDVKVRSVIDPGTVTNGTRTENRISKEYCGTNGVAADLVKLLAPLFSPAPVIVQDQPLLGVGGMYVQTDTVPYLEFKGFNFAGQAVTFAENAGQLAEAFMHNYPPAFALNQIIRWILMDLESAVPSE